MLGTCVPTTLLRLESSNFIVTITSACTSLYNLPPLSTGLDCFCCLYQPVQPASSFCWSWLLLLLVPACTTWVLFLLVLAASVACTSLYNLPPLSTGLGCFCCLYQPVQPASSFYWSWLLLLLVPACTTCLLFLLVLAASVACFSADNTRFRSMQRKPTFMKAPCSRLRIWNMGNLPISPSLCTIAASYTATSSPILPTNTLFGHRFQIKWWKLSFEFCVPPWVHLDNKLSVLSVSNTGLIAFNTNLGRDFLLALSTSP